MKSILLTVLLSSAILATAEDKAPAAPGTPATPAAAAPAAAAPAADPHDAHAASSGIKKELIAGLTEKDFLKLSDKEKTVKLTVVAVWSEANYGMNFNGHSKGSAVYTIPKDWKVEVTFINPSPIPHSLIVIEKEAAKKIQVAEPYFKGGATPKHTQGIAYDKASFTFTADEVGEYALACGFPGHCMNGHWICLDVSDTLKVPTFKEGEKAAVEATK